VKEILPQRHKERLAANKHERTQKIFDFNFVLFRVYSRLKKTL